MRKNKKKSKSLKKGFYITVLAVFALLFFGLRGIDADRYKGQISSTLSEKLGREIKVDGPIKIGFSFENGIGFSVGGVSISNPGWASRPVMAHVGKLEMGLDLYPLINRRISINRLVLADADIALESNAEGASNLNFASENKEKLLQDETGASRIDFFRMSVDVERVSIKNSRVVIVSQGGDVLRLIADSLSLKPASKGVAVAFVGSIDGNKTKISLIGDDPFSILKAPWNFEGTAEYGQYTIYAAGTLRDDLKKLNVARYKVDSKDTTLTGGVDVSYGEGRPKITGRVESDYLDIADLKLDSGKSEGNGKKAQSISNQPERVFSQEPINIKVLKSIDAELDVSIGKMPLKVSSIERIRAKLDLADGRLLISPVSMVFADSDLRGQVKLDASGDIPRMSFLIKAHQIDFSKLVKLWGLGALLSGKGDLDADVISVGNSPHELAENSNGTVNLVMASGKIDVQEMRLIIGSIIDTILPGAGFLAGGTMNCLAARFVINNGLMKTDGVLLDTPTMSAVAYGGISLGSELINMRVVTDNKSGTTNLFPPLLISGDLSGPGIKPEIDGTIQKFTGAVLGNGGFGDLLGINTANNNNAYVPDVVSVGGQNACVYTLDHPTAKKAATSNATNQNVEAVNKAVTKTQDAIGRALNGLRGKLLGN